MRTYAELPAYLEHFDAAILPFAINDATRFISPTKTLEYLAGDKPVVSTPVHDVVALYGGVVNIASTPSAFVEAIEQDWSMSGTERTTRRSLVNEVLAKHSWDVISTSMERLIEAAQERRWNLRGSAGCHPWTRVRCFPPSPTCTPVSWGISNV
jgi:glycosyltransferase involved in cell wall biosynthesis